MNETKHHRTYQPIRKTMRDKLPLDDQLDVYPYDATPNKLEQILGKPEAPIRNTRKAKRGNIKSMGEEVTDSGSLDKGLFWEQSMNSR